VIAKVLSSVAIAVISAVAVAEPAAAEPSAFSVLSCTCESGVATFVHSSLTVRQQIDAGIESGFADLQGISEQPAA